MFPIKFLSDSFFHMAALKALHQWTTRVSSSGEKKEVLFFLAFSTAATVAGNVGPEHPNVA